MVVILSWPLSVKYSIADTSFVIMAETAVTILKDNWHNVLLTQFISGIMYFHAMKAMSNALAVVEYHHTSDVFFDLRLNKRLKKRFDMPVIWDIVMLDNEFHCLHYSHIYWYC